MTTGPDPKDDASGDPRREARVFAAMEDAARARAAEDARDRLVLATARPSRLVARIRAWWRRSPPG